MPLGRVGGRSDSGGIIRRCWVEAGVRGALGAVDAAQLQPGDVAGRWPVCFPDGPRGALSPVRPAGLGADDLAAGAVECPLDGAEGDDLAQVVIRRGGRPGPRRGLSNNGTASGGRGLKTAGLPPLAVRMQSPGGNDREGREAGQMLAGVFSGGQAWAIRCSSTRSIMVCSSRAGGSAREKETPAPMPVRPVPRSGGTGTLTGDSGREGGQMTPAAVPVRQPGPGTPPR